jgi:putative ABC transport system permease protein
MKLLPFEYGVRNLGRSPTRLVATILSCTLVVSLVLVAASFVRGMSRSLVMNTDPANVILVAAGSEESLERSQIDGAAAGIVASDVAGLKTRLGVPYVSPEIHVALLIRSRGDSPEELRAVFRGITPEAFLVHPRAQVVEGRMPKPGREEIMVGSLAAEKMGVDKSTLRVGDHLWFDNRSWTIVGRFRAAGTVMDGEIWAPLSDLKVVTKRETVSCIVVTLGDGDFADLDAFTKQRLDLGLVAIREADYYATLMKFYRPVQGMVWATAMLIGLAGLLGGLNTMYAAFSARMRELGMLQSLGYSRAAITLSFAQESVVASAAGTLLGSALCLVMLDGFAVRFSMGVFQLSIDHAVLLIGMSAGLLLGVVGALPPAWRCLRIPITQALKAA